MLFSFLHTKKEAVSFFCGNTFTLSLTARTINSPQWCPRVFVTWKVKGFVPKVRLFSAESMRANQRHYSILQGQTDRFYITMFYKIPLQTENRQHCAFVISQPALVSVCPLIVIGHKERLYNGIRPSTYLIVLRFDQLPCAWWKWRKFIRRC